MPPCQAPPALPDVLEAQLASALAEYRYRAEDILDAHRDKLESLESQYQMEMSNLRAENYQLRLKMGLKQNGQTVLIGCDDHYDDGKKKKIVAIENLDKSKMARTNTTMNKDAKNMPIRTGGDMQHTATVAGYVNNANGAHGGIWQQFVAWVPNGALVRPEPWKSLSDDVMEVLGEEEVVSEKESNSEEGEYHLLETWQTSEEEAARTARRKARLKGNGSTVGDDVSEYTGDAEEIDDLFAQEQVDSCAIHPHSRPRGIWDMMSLMMVVYDMIMIPMTAFELPEENFFLLTMQWSTRLFWSADMAMSCLTGIVMSDGNVRLSIGYSVHRYMKTWLILDIIIVGSDWGSFILTSMGGAGSLGRFTRVFRGVRAVRLLRLARMREVIDKITERVQSDKLQFAFSLIKQTLLIVVTSHFIACCWWGVGTISTEGTWVAKAGYNVQALDSQYLVSLHWALSQFSGGMDEVSPEAAGERFFAVITWILTFMISAIVVSSITSNLTQMHIVGGSTARQLATLRKYLNQNAISSNLALRMQRSAQHALSGDLTPDLVDLLPVVSEPLRVEMHFEIYADVLKKHPFFSELMIESPLIMRRICHFATTTLILSHGEILFSQGEAPAHPRMYFIAKGHLDYKVDHEEVIVVSEGQWVSEACMWSNWVYKGTMTATSDVKIAAVEARAFQDLLTRFRDSVCSESFDPKRYAEWFVKSLNDSIADPNDVTMFRGG